MAEKKKKPPYGFDIPDDPKSLTKSQYYALILELRTGGWTPNQIGEALGQPAREVSRVLRLLVRQTGRLLFRKASEMVDLEVQRMERLTTALWRQAEEGSTRAVEVLIKLMERRARLLGLDAPTKIEQKVDISLESLSLDELKLKAVQLGMAVVLEAPKVPELLPGEEDGSHSIPISRLSSSVAEHGSHEESGVGGGQEHSSPDRTSLVAPAHGLGLLELVCRDQPDSHSQTVETKNRDSVYGADGFREGTSESGSAGVAEVGMGRSVPHHPLGLDLPDNGEARVEHRSTDSTGSETPKEAEPWDPDTPIFLG